MSITVRRTKEQSALRSTHRLYDKALPKWCRSRDALEGGDALRDAGTKYLPKLQDQTIAEYEAYLQRPNFYDATSRTSEALSGLVFSRPMSVDVPPELEKLLEDLDFAGQDVEDFARMTVDEVLGTGRGLIVVNHNGDPTKPGTMAAPSGRPWLAFYNAESFLDWRTRKRDGAQELIYAKVREVVELPGETEFSVTCREQFRIFDLDGEGYRQRVFIEVTPSPANPTGIQMIEESFPVINGKRWEFVPAVIVGLNGKAEPGPIPLLPVADTNISHWRTSADLEHGAHFAGLPTPVFTGFQVPKGEKIRIGSSEAITSEQPDAKAFFMQVNGDSMAILERLIDRKEQHLAALGARMLMPEKGQAESGAALTIRQGGESGALARVAVSVSSALTKAVQLMALWIGVKTPDKAVNIELNKQFVDERIQAPEITALMAAWQGGGMSKPTLIYNFQRGGRLQEGQTVDDEIEAIGEEPPPLATVTEDPPPNDPAGPPPGKKPKRVKGNGATV